MHINRFYSLNTFGVRVCVCLCLCLCMALGIIMYGHHVYSSQTIRIYGNMGNNTEEVKQTSIPIFENRYDHACASSRQHSEYEINPFDYVLFVLLFSSSTAISQL